MIRGNHSGFPRLIKIFMSSLDQGSGCLWESLSITWLRLHWRFKNSVSVITALSRRHAITYRILSALITLDALTTCSLVIGDVDMDKMDLLLPARLFDAHLHLFTRVCVDIQYSDFLKSVQSWNTLTNSPIVVASKSPNRSGHLHWHRISKSDWETRILGRLRRRWWGCSFRKRGHLLPGFPSPFQTRKNACFGWYRFRLRFRLRFRFLQNLFNNQCTLSAFKFKLSKWCRELDSL